MSPTQATRVTLRFDTSPLAHTALVSRVRGVRPRLAPPPVRDDVRHVAARAWEDRARGEYVGVLVVRRFHGLLVDLGAPADHQEVALAMLAQEQRHVGLCMDAARALGHDGNVEFALGELQQARTREPLAHQLLDMVLGTWCVGEVVAHALLRHTLDVLPPSGFKDTHRAIFRDQVLHASIGPLLLADMRAGTWFPWPGDDVATALYDRHRAWMATRDVVEPDEAALFGDRDAAAQLMVVGVPPPAGLLASYRASLDALPRPLPLPAAAPDTEAAAVAR